MRTDWDPLGVEPDGNGGAHVALWAAGAEGVDLCVFADDGGEHRIPIHNKLFNVFHEHVPNLPVGTRYGFRVHGPWDPAKGHRWNSSKLLIDPYAKAIEGDFILDPAVFGHVEGDDLAVNFNDSAPFIPKSILVDNAFDWGEDAHPGIPWGDTVIYEAHVRGMTKLHPGIPESIRGTYAGVAHPLVIEHLTYLGITAIELLPTHHFLDEVHLVEAGLKNYWGYNSIGYFAPHSRYAASKSRGGQVAEFREMVKALHAANIEVILDVVYNHTAEGSELGPTLSFRGIDNDDYYRLADGGRRYTDYTGCGNTLNASNPHVLQLIMDSLRYWVTQMHVDGFRFDLASALARSFHDVDMLGNFMTTLQQDPILRRVKLIAEPWDIGPGGYQVGEFPPLWTEWNGKYRDNVRDFWRSAVGVSELGSRLTGSADLYASDGRRPFASINFITAHDGFTMRDLVSYEHKHNEANLEGNRDGSNDNRSANYGVEGETDNEEINEVRRRQIRNMLGTLILSTGVPMISSGDESGKTQGGNNNAYCQDNPISWLDWDWNPWQRDLFEFTCSVMQLRRRHLALRQRFFFHGRPIQEGGPKDLEWFGPDGQDLSVQNWNSPDTRTLGMMISGQMRPSTSGNPLSRDDSFLLLLNSSPATTPFVLPDISGITFYRRLIDTTLAKAHDSSTHFDELPGSTIAMSSRCLMLFRAG